MDIVKQRLVAQGILTPQTDDVAEVVRHLLAMQSQDYAGALWSIGLRMKSPSLRAVEKAIAERKIVRTWPMRGTLHFLAAEDVHWMVDLLAPRVTASVRNRRVNMLGLTDAVVDEAEKALRAELEGGRNILRNQVAPLLASNVKGLKIDNQHVQHLMRNFGERGIICFGPHEGKQPTFVLLDEWIPKPKQEKPREDALKELATRYFTSHGPATLKDFAGWGYMTMTEARKGLELARTDLEEIVVSDTTYYHAPVLEPVDTPQAHSKPTNAVTLERSEGSKGRFFASAQNDGIPSVFLLPGFDEYLLGYKDRSPQLAYEHANKIVPGGNGMFLATIVQDGQVVGTWKKQIKKAGPAIAYLPFHPSGFDEKLFKQAEDRYRAFLES